MTQYQGLKWFPLVQMKLFTPNTSLGEHRFLTSGSLKIVAKEEKVRLVEAAELRNCFHKGLSL